MTALDLRPMVLATLLSGGSGRCSLVERNSLPMILPRALRIHLPCETARAMRSHLDSPRFGGGSRAGAA